MIAIKKQFSIALLYFSIAASLGVFLRALHVFNIDVNYRYIVHSHSHIALLGWVYLAVTTLLYSLFIPKSIATKKRYKYIFWLTQITLVGMLLTFPFQGYALLSIIFSTLFLFASYWFTNFFLKNIALHYKQMLCFPYLKYALYYLVISSIGPWSLGGIMVTLGPSSIWYRLSIYFYLHFQYNGWMLMAIIGLFIFILEKHNIIVNSNKQQRNKMFLFLLNISITLTFFLSTLWTQPHVTMYILSMLGSIIQFALLAYAIVFMYQKQSTIKSHFSKIETFLFKSILLLLAVKLLLQIIGSTPYFANLAAAFTGFTIAYLHWVFLGVLTISLFLIASLSEILSLNKTSIILYFLGFVVTEGIIIYKAIAQWQQWSQNIEYQPMLLLIASIILFTSIVLIGFKSFKKSFAFTK